MQKQCASKQPRVREIASSIVALNIQSAQFFLALARAARHIN